MHLHKIGCCACEIESRESLTCVPQQPSKLRDWTCPEICPGYPLGPYHIEKMWGLREGRLQQNAQSKNQGTSVVLPSFSMLYWLCDILAATQSEEGPIKRIFLSVASAFDEASRFKHSSSAGAYLGLTPRRYESGEVSRNGRISKHGNKMTRKHLYEAATMPRLPRSPGTSPFRR